MRAGRRSGAVKRDGGGEVMEEIGGENERILIGGRGGGRGGEGSLMVGAFLALHS